MKTLNTFSVAALAFALASSVGCSNIGGSPPGASQEQMKATFDSQTPEIKAQMILDAPGDAAQKASHIKDIFAKAGKPVPDDIAKRMGGGPVPTGH